MESIKKVLILLWWYSRWLNALKKLIVISFHKSLYTNEKVSKKNWIDYSSFLTSPLFIERYKATDCIYLQTRFVGVRAQKKGKVRKRERDKKTEKEKERKIGNIKDRPENETKNITKTQTEKKQKAKIHKTRQDKIKPQKSWNKNFYKR